MGKQITLSSGIAVECLPIALLIEKWQAQHPLPEPPTYEVKTAGGVVERHPHDATTLDTDEDKAAWATYQDKLAAADKARSEALTKLALLRGLKVELPADDGWIQEQEFLGLRVPTEPHERKLHWLTTEALLSLDDYEAVLAGVFEASGVPEEAVAEKRDSFRRALGVADGTDAERPAEAAAPDAELAHQQPV